MHRSTLATLAQTMYNFLEAQGLDAKDIFHRAELDPAKLYDADARFPIHGMNRLWSIAEQESNSPTIIYDVLPCIELHMLHAMGHAWMASRNLLEGLQRFVRYHRMLSTNMDIKLVQSATTCKLIGETLDTAGRVANETALAFCLQICCRSYGEDLAPIKVQLVRPKPEITTLINKFYRCPIEYDCKINVIHFSLKDLSRRLMGANAEIAVAMEEVIAKYLTRFDANDVESRVRSCVAKMLVYSEPTKQELADELKMTPRTLQRRLEEQGSSVNEIIDDTRHHLAVDFLAMDHYSVKEVAFNLGFSDPSNFARAFKRWEGVTPKEFRTQM